MCPPTLYEVDYVINPWMDGNVHCASRKRAEEQWTNLHNALAAIARVILINPQPGSPDMVFTANAGLVRNNVAVLSSFFCPERQGEEQHFRAWFQQAGLSLEELRRETPFEGEGDALFDADGTRLWAGYGFRSSAEAHSRLREAWGVPVISLKLVDPRFYHLDTCFCPLFGGYVLYFPAAFDSESLVKIESGHPPDKLIPVDEADAVHFACNAVNVGRTVILNQASQTLQARLEAAGFSVIQVELTEFLKAGGAAKCLTLRLSELDVTHQGAGKS